MKKVLVVDDSALMRRVIFDIINADRELSTERYAVNGLEALDLLKSGQEFDVIILDINMPKMNGIEFLREFKKLGRKEQVLVVSTLAKEGAKETIQALELGAFDFVTKPDSLAVARGDDFGKRLVTMVRVAAGLSADLVGETFLPKGNEPSQTKGMSTAQQTLKSQAGKSAAKFTPSQENHSTHAVALSGNKAKKLVALACSTGGPKALQYVVPFLPANLDAPVLIVQHMPEGFTASLSARLDELSRIRVVEAEHEAAVKKGTVYIAKGGSQMRLIEGGKKELSLSVTVEEARNGLRPCADIMYESLISTSFDEITCVVMTGMGADGTKGILQLKQTNKLYVIAQDEESSTVYGMPKAVYDAGVVDEVAELKQIADAITKHVGVR